MTFTRRDLVLGTIALGCQSSLAPAASPAIPASRWLALPDPQESIDLWPGAAPGRPRQMPTEKVVERSVDRAFNDRYITGIVRPRMALFRPRRPDGSAALIIPGGGYERVVVDKEGFELARWLAERGTTAFVLFYRLPGDGWAAGPDAPLADAQRAMRLIRQRSAGFAVDPRRVASIGFSAGGHLCAKLLTRFGTAAYIGIDRADQLSSRPDAAAVIYPVISMSEPLVHRGSRSKLIGDNAGDGRRRAQDPSENVPASAPPVFLLHAEDDTAVPVGNSLLFRQALVRAGVSTETHLFPDGGHGFGLRLAKGRSVENWQDRLLDWGRRLGFFGPVRP